MMNHSITSDLSYGDQYDLSPDLSIYSPSNSPDSDSDNDDNSDSESSDFDFQSLTVFYTNADQFLNKRDELQMFIAGNEPDIILISEILPKSHCNTISSSRLSLNGYNMFFNFDPDGCQPATSIRGVGIYVSKRITVSEYHFTSSSFQDHIWISISLKGSDKLLVGCIYRSPSSELSSSTNSLCELFKSIPSQKFSHVLICGDFNYPGHCHQHQLIVSNYFLILLKICISFSMYKNQHDTVTPPPAYLIWFLLMKKE